MCDLAVGLAGVKGGIARRRGGDELGCRGCGGIVESSVVGRLIACLHPYMYGNVLNSAVRIITCVFVCVYCKVLCMQLGNEVARGCMCYQADEMAYMLFSICSCVRFSLFHIEMDAFVTLKHRFHIVK